MKAVILAAGEGTRMRPFTRGQPKVMLSVGNRPLLEYVIEALARNGVRDLIMVVGYRKERIMSYFGDGKNWRVGIQYVHQEKQLGTAHAFRTAEDHLRNERHFLLLSGDNIVEEEDLTGLVDSPEPEALLITQSQLSTKYGVVQQRGNRVVSIEEKPVVGYEGQIFTGIGRFTPDIFNYLYDGIFTLTSLIKERLKRSTLLALPAKSWMDAVYPQDLLRINTKVLRDLPAGYGGIVEPGVVFKDHVNVAEGTILRAHTYLKGPVVIGEGCAIGPSAAIMGSTSIGENTSIGPFCEIKNCIIMDDVTIDMGAKLENAVIGAGTVLGPRFTARRHSIRENVREGIAIGEDCEIEENVIVDSGVTIGNAVKIEPGKHITRSLDDSNIVI